MINQTNDIAQMIVSYTDQIARYENLSTWYAAFCAVCIFAALSLALLLSIRRRTAQGSKRIYTIALSGTFLMIPVITTLYLYTFSMNMRKVAMYRGYLSFLERQWNIFAGADIMLFDGDLIGKFFSFENFWVNGLGPGVMSIFVVLTIVFGFGLSLHFLQQLRTSKEKTILQLLVGILLVVCILFNGLCTYYLSINDQVVESVAAYCEK